MWPKFRWLLRRSRSRWASAPGCSRPRSIASATSFPPCGSSGPRTTSRSPGSTTTARSRVWRAGSRSSRRAGARARGRLRCRGSGRPPQRGNRRRGVTAPGGLTATAPVVVQQTEVAILEQSPIALSPGDVDTLHVAVPAQGNRLVNPLSVQWSSGDATVARVSLTGVVAAVAPGRTTVTVSGLLQTKAAELVVHRVVEALAVVPSARSEVPLPIQGSAKYQVQAIAADKTPVPEAPLRWSVTDTSLASFDPSTTTLTGKKAGKTTLTVRGPGQGLAVTWAVRVIAANLRLSSSRIGLALSRRYPVKANFADEAGAVIGPATGVTWASDNPQVASVGDDGTAAAVGYGHARVTATAPGGRRATADVYVQGDLVLASSRSSRFQLYSVERSNLA